MLVPNTRYRPTLTLVVSCLAYTTAQSFPQTAGWRDPLISLSYNDRLSLAEGALNVTYPRNSLGKTDGNTTSHITQAAAMFYASSEYDRRSKSAVFKDTIPPTLNSFASAANFTDMTCLNSDRLRLGLAYMSAHLAYPDSPQAGDLLTAAISLWNAAGKLFVTSADASAGSLSGTGKFNSTCVPKTGGSSQVSVAGAISFTGPPSTNGETIGPWIALSSLLYTSRQDQTYMDRAATSIAFVKTFLSNGVMIFDHYDYGACALTQWQYTYNGGFFLQGLGAYYNSRSSPPTADESEYVNELAASLILTPHWTGSDAINVEDAITNSTKDISAGDLTADWKAILVEGLYQCLTTGLLNDTVANLTQQYISVQYNAVRELANFTAPDIAQQVYGPSWNGSARNLTELDLPGQLAATELFVTALGIGPGAPNKTVSSSHPAVHSHIQTGPIVGGVIGGMVVIAGVVLAVLFWRRRKRRISTKYLIEDSPSRATFGNTEPFCATNEQFPLSERDRALSKHELASRAALDSSIEGDSATSERGLIDRSQDGAEGMVPVDAGALQRLLLNVGGALSDLQHRNSRSGGDASSVANEPPPDYEEGASRGH